MTAVQDKLRIQCVQWLQIQIPLPCITICEGVWKCSHWEGIAEGQKLIDTIQTFEMIDTHDGMLGCNHHLCF